MTPFGPAILYCLFRILSENHLSNLKLYFFNNSQLTTPSETPEVGSRRLPRRILPALLRKDVIRPIVSWHLRRMYKIDVTSCITSCTIRDKPSDPVVQIRSESVVGRGSVFTSEASIHIYYTRLDSFYTFLRVSASEFLPDPSKWMQKLSF